MTELANHGEPIDREEAKRLIDRADVGWLVVVEEELVPVLGHVDPEDHEVELTRTTYRFGDMDVLQPDDEDDG